MAMEGLPEVVPPSGRVPGQRLLATPILKRRRRRYREEIRKKISILGVSSVGVIYRRRGQPGGPPGSQAPPWRGQPLGRATRAPRSLVVALWPHPGDSRMFRHADFLSDFFGIFGEILIVGKPEIENQQKTRTGTEVH